MNTEQMNLVLLVNLVILDAIWMWSGCGLLYILASMLKINIYIGINAHVTMRDGKSNEQTIEDKATHYSAFELGG